MKPWCLVVRLGAIGDNLIASSILPILARDYNVEVMAQSPWHVIFENNPHIAKLTVREPGDLPEDINQWQAFFVHRGKEYAKWMNLSHSCEAQLALFPGQTQFYWPASWRRNRCGVNYLEYVHQIAEVGGPYEPGFFPTEEEKTKAEQTLDKVRGDGGFRHVVGIALSGSRFDKIWPYMPMLVGKLVRELHVAVVMFGAERETPMAKQIQDFVAEYNGSHTGMHAAISPDKDNPSWPIRRTLATVQACDLVIAPDTGLAWAVAAEKMPKIILLSHASPENITKHWRNTVTLHADPVRVPCAPCHQLHDYIDTCRKATNANASACIADITEESVYLAVKAALKGDSEHGGDCGLSGKGDAGFQPERGGGHPTLDLGSGPVAGGAILNVGI